MTQTNPAFLVFMEQQRADYRRSLPQRLAGIETLWRQILDDRQDAHALDSLERQAHSLAGSSATFGFAALGEAARVVELAVHPLVNSTGSLTPAMTVQVGLAIQTLLGSLPSYNPVHSSQ
ncbi:MAG: hypothetical protein HHJ16_05305 [Polaromonas sp.]|uniref:Hpt domain-containing protein n=1 Tax=Polaromonas sp. TaxID=1869339 RepID=UPI001803734F|nr:Hpt domain-containing protein [Polaromonas sp.]NMM09673.1 hypothetical protein [Polaromonas sp.]